MVATTTGTLTSNTHLGALCLVTSSRQYFNKSESPNYTANGYSKLPFHISVSVVS